MPKTSVRVLLVEDNGPTAVAIRAVLERSAEASFEITTASRLSGAMKCLREDDYDAVLLDLNLPDSDGLETVRKLRALDADTPILVLTAHEESALGKGALAAGAQDFFMKSSVESRLLARAILRVCKRPGD